jgi:hypothetical protein
MGVDFRVRVRDMTVLSTPRATNAHMKTRYGDNMEAINVCYIDLEKKVRISIHKYHLRSLYSVANITIDCFVILIDAR